MVFSEPKGLSPTERLSIAQELQRRLRQFEATADIAFDATQVVIEGESDDASASDEAPLIVGATHSLTIFYDEFSVEAETAFLEYGSIGDAMDSAYVLRVSLDRFAKKRKLPLSGFVRIVLANTGVYGDSLGVEFGFGKPIKCDRFKIAFHGTVDLTQSSAEWFAEEFLREQILMRPNQVVVSPLR